MHDAIIVGGGLAGCGLAIQLAQQGQQVLLLEQQHYPTHKLCGEFLSVEVTEIFQRLGILDAVRAAGAVAIRRALLTTSTGESFRSQLPGQALGLSRFALDQILWQRAREVGATCLDRTPVTAVEGTLAEGFTVATAAQIHRGRLVVGAYGKCSRLDRQRGRPFVARPSPFLALKGHVTGLHLEDTVELHGFPGGYCGFSEIEAGRVNVCWIGHGGLMRDAAGGLPPSAPSFPAALRLNPTLARRLETMVPVAGATRSLRRISFALKGTFDDDLWMIGDTAGMIAPLCGDGMAMALGSADLALPLALAFLSGTIGPSELKHRYRQEWNRAFRGRLLLGRLLQQGFIHPSLARWAVGLCGRMPTLGDALIRSTRGPAPALTAC